MALFRYRRPAEPAEAFARGAAPGAQFVAGGTDLLQLVQERIARPAEVIDLALVTDARIEAGPEGVRIGAGARLADVAAHPQVARRCAVVAQALEGTASPQVRNLATAGGNLLQRTRCLYFRDATTPCNKREPGSGCSAMEGQNRINAILGGSDHCIAVQPSDFAVALVACDAEIEIAGGAGARRVAAADLHRLPGDTPQIETVLGPGEVITAIHLPAAAGERRSRYLKVRDRASFEWAICACALSLKLDGAEVAEARVVAGGVATKPWRLASVEQALIGRALEEETIAQAAARAADGAEPRAHNAYKVPLLEATVRKALREFAAA